MGRGTLRGLLTWGLLGAAIGAYIMANADGKTQRMVRQRGQQLGRRMRRAAVRSGVNRSTAERVLEAGRGAMESTLDMLRIR